MSAVRNSSVNRTLVRLAVPTIVMNISTPLLGAVDTAVVGHLQAVQYLGAVSLGSLLFTMIYWAVGFFRMSTVGLAAQSHGRGDRPECAHLLLRALLLAGVLGLGVIASRDAVVWVAMRWFDASPDVEALAAQYFRIRVFSAPAAFVLMIFQGWFYGVRNVRDPVLITVVVNVLNVGLDFLFVVGWGFASDGVAWATVIAQYLGVALTAALFLSGYRDYARHFSLARALDPGKLWEILALNGDIFLRTLSLQFANLYFMTKSAALGDLLLAANTILLQMRYLSSYALDGFATAAEVVVGAAVGARDRAQLLAAIRLSLRWGVAVGAGISGVYLAASPWWPAWFTDNPEVLPLVGTYLGWILLEPWISNVCFILDGVYVGATATRRMRNAMMLSVFGVFLPAVEVLGRLYGNHGMWAATLALYVARAATLGWPLRRLAQGSEARIP